MVERTAVPRVVWRVSQKAVLKVGHLVASWVSEMAGNWADWLADKTAASKDYRMVGHWASKMVDRTVALTDGSMAVSKVAHSAAMTAVRLVVLMDARSVGKTVWWWAVHLAESKADKKAVHLDVHWVGLLDV